jgi:hypothetical protein
MEGFTLVLLIGWLFLLGCTIAMYYMDKATKAAEAKRAQAAERDAAGKRR